MKFDPNQYKIYTWKHPAMIHWMLNPGIIINELFFGQRTPKISLVDKTTGKSRFESSFIPCPHCEKLHDARIWSSSGGVPFKNWFGLYCTDCGGIIPCLINVFTYLLLAVTYPMWGWFRHRLKAKWLRSQPARYQNIEIESISHGFENRRWIISGLSWGLLMFLFMGIALPYFSSQEITVNKLLSGIVNWTIAGLGYGYVMKLFYQSSLATKPTSQG